jgi:hypothetical protein
MIQGAVYQMMLDRVFFRLFCAVSLLHGLDVTAPVRSEFGRFQRQTSPSQWTSVVAGTSRCADRLACRPLRGLRDAWARIVTAVFNAIFPRFTIQQFSF